MNRGRWKRQEREVAELLGGKRNPCTGGWHQDVTTPLFAVEVKTRKSLPDWLTEAVEQAVRAADESQVPIVALNEVSQGRKARRYILLRLEDWVDLHGNGG